MRISRRDKVVLYNDSLWDRKCQLEYVISDTEDGLLYTDEDSERKELEELLESYLIEIQSVYRVMHQIYLELHDKENLHREEYDYWDRVMK